MSASKHPSQKRYPPGLRERAVRMVLTSLYRRRRVESDPRPRWGCGYRLKRGCARRHRRWLPLGTTGRAW